MSSHIEGTWTLYFAWYTWNGAPTAPQYHPKAITFNSGGSTSDGGTWTESNGSVTITYDSAPGWKTLYLGSIQGYAMLGTMQNTGPDTTNDGWWYAVKNDIPTGTADDDSGLTSHQPISKS